MKRLLGILGARRIVIALLLIITAPSAFAGATLDGVIARGVLRCGVSEGIVGFSAQDGAGRWHGFDVDFCRAVAAATFGDPEKVAFVPLKASTRFPALQAGVIDLLVRQTTWTLLREALLNVRFPGVLYYDSQKFMVPANSGVTGIAGLADAKICVEKGTTHEQNLSEYLAARDMRAERVIIDSAAGAAAALFAGKCLAYSSDAAQLASALLSAPDGGRGFVILPESIRVQPLAPAVLAGDEEWFLIVRWVLFAQIAAEQYGLTQANIEQVVAQSHDPRVTRLSAADGTYGKALHIRGDWAVRAILAVGNYGEMFERNLGANSELKIERGPNRLWTDGGLLYAPPFR